MINDWLERLKSRIIPPKIAGVQLLISKEGILASAILLQSDNGNLSVNDTFQPTTDWESMLAKIPKSYPITLAINGRGILHKNIAIKQDLMASANQLFPNIKQSDFYFQLKEMEQGNIISLVKNDLLEELREKINEAKLQLVGFSIGAFEVSGLFLLNSNYLSYQALNQELLLSEKGHIISYSNNSSTIPAVTVYKFDELEIHQDQLVGFAAGFNYLMEAHSSISFTGYEEQKKEYLFGQIWRLALPVVLGGFLLLMLLNTFLFYQLKDGSKKRQLELVTAQQKLEEVKDKKATLALQSKLFEETGANRISTASFYADRIGQSLPKSIQLLELELFPAKKVKRNNRKKELVKYDPNLIEIRGICESSQVYSDWLKHLELASWTASVTHEDFRDIDKKHSEFLLTIELGALKMLGDNMN